MSEMSISENKRYHTFQHSPKGPSCIASLGSAPDGIGGVALSSAVIQEVYAETSEEGFQAELISGVVRHMHPGMGVHKKHDFQKSITRNVYI